MYHHVNTKTQLSISNHTLRSWFCILALDYSFTLTSNREPHLSWVVTTLRWCYHRVHQVEMFCDSNLYCDLVHQKQWSTADLVRIQNLKLISMWSGPHPLQSVISNQEGHKLNLDGFFLSSVSILSANKSFFSLTLLKLSASASGYKILIKESSLSQPTSSYL